MNLLHRAPIKNLVAPFGFFGAGNVGDEATLQGFGRLIAGYDRSARVWVASRDPAHTARAEPSFKYYRAGWDDLRGRWARYRASAQVIVGGTPIMDVLGNWPLNEVVPFVQGAHRRNKPVVFLGSGTETLQREHSRRVVRDVLAPIVRHWTVRSESDRDRLLLYGVNPSHVTVAADLAWLLHPVSALHGRSYLASLGLNPSDRFLAVNLTKERFVSDQRPELFQAIAAFLDAAVVKHDLRILFLANETRPDETFDTAASRTVLSHMKRSDSASIVPANYRTPQEMLSLIACCEVTLSMRYHFCLFSALQGIPFIALKRSDKVADLCWDLRWPSGISLGDTDVSRMLDLLSESIDGATLLRAQLNDRIIVLKERALRNTVALQSLEVQ
jgi:polysaccharide pyruvyl transferase WcaK-like protein